MINSDCYTDIGKSHFVCQDYAWCRQVTGPIFPFQAAIISDGCSSSPDTDIGARLLVRTAYSNILLYGSSFKLNTITMKSLENIVRGQFLLSNHCLDATLLTAIENEKGDVLVRIYGDGLALGRRKTGEIDYYLIEFSNNAPGYLSYLLDEKALDYFINNKINGERCGTRFICQNFNGRRTNSWEHLSSTNLDTMFYSIVFPKDFYDLVLISTDGIRSFQKKENTGELLDLSEQDVINQLLDIKGFTGQFFKRRCMKFFNNFCKDNQWQHTDDFGAAVIHLG